MTGTGSAFLDRMIASKRDAMSGVCADERREMRQRAMESVAAREKTRRLSEVLRSDDRANIIAEVKRSSPSAGAIRAEADAVGTALTYEAAGAVAISVLTEPEYFKGSLGDLVEVVARVSVPVLRKDFTVDAYQIYEAAAAGASAVLLIVAALSFAELKTLRMVAEEELGLDALVEAHTAHEVEKALAAGATVVGVNNRNLQTLEVSLATSRELAKLITADAVFVAESGIKTSDDVETLRGLGYRGFLVGETLMRAADPATALRALSQGGAR